MKTAKKQPRPAKRRKRQPEDRHTVIKPSTSTAYWRDEDFKIHGMQNFDTLEQAQVFADDKNRTSVRYIYFVGD